MGLRRPYPLFSETNNEDDKKRRQGDEENLDPQERRPQRGMTFRLAHSLPVVTAFSLAAFHWRALVLWTLLAAFPEKRQERRKRECFIACFVAVRGQHSTS